MKRREIPNFFETNSVPTKNGKKAVPIKTSGIWAARESFPMPTAHQLLR